MMQKSFGEHLIITRETRGKLPSLPFLRIKNAILGPSYELSLVFVGRQRAIEFHKEWKKKNDPVNILSFPLSSSEGEIIISLEKARSECRHFDRGYENYLAFLFVHGCMHLKGYTHGNAMEAAEKKIRTQFGI
jgi:probable rRNA maturation factor